MNKKGSIILGLLLVSILSCTVLTLLQQVFMHNRIQRARLKHNQMLGRLQDRLLLELHDFRRRLAQPDLQAHDQPELSFFSKDCFPDLLERDFLVSHSFSAIPLAATAEWSSFRVRDGITAACRKTSLATRASAVIELHRGRLPLSSTAVFLNSKQENKLPDLLAAGIISVSGQSPTASAAFDLQDELTRLANSMLEMPGKVIDWRRLREKAGLEPLDTAPEPGIYLIREDDQLQTIFIQGDCREMVFSADEDRQTILFQVQQESCFMEYLPGRKHLRTWLEEEAQPLLFRERILVNGSVYNLRQAGEQGFHLQTGLQIMASGPVMITPPLTGPNPRLGPMQLPGLMLLSSGTTLDGNKCDTGLTVAAGAADRAVIQANLITSGSFSRPGKVDLILQGSLLASDIKSQSRLIVDGRESALPDGQTPMSSSLVLVKSLNLEAFNEVKHE